MFSCDYPTPQVLHEPLHLQHPHVHFSHAGVERRRRRKAIRSELVFHTRAERRGLKHTVPGSSRARSQQPTPQLYFFVITPRVFGSSGMRIPKTTNSPPKLPNFDVSSEVREELPSPFFLSCPVLLHQRGRFLVGPFWLFCWKSAPDYVPMQSPMGGVSAYLLVSNSSSLFSAITLTPLTRAKSRRSGAQQWSSISQMRGIQTSESGRCGFPCIEQPPSVRVLPSSIPAHCWQILRWRC
jgi:hypothetical protein